MGLQGSILLGGVGWSWEGIGSVGMVLVLKRPRMRVVLFGGGKGSGAVMRRMRGVRKCGIEGVLLGAEMRGMWTVFAAIGGALLVHPL